jgi:hypothetical protein
MLLLLSLACNENRLHNLDSVPVVQDTQDSVQDTQDSVHDTQDTQLDPCEDAPEHESVCDDVDEDCDGTTDEGQDLEGCTQYWPNPDGDALGAGDAICVCDQPDGYADAPGDCDNDDGARLVCRSCLDVLEQGFGSTDGAYTIDPDGAGTFEVLCDMTTDGGGWTLVTSVNAQGLTHYDAADVFETKSSFGVHSDDNYLSPAFYRLSFTSSYLIDETHGVPVVTETAWAGATLGQEVDAIAAGASTGFSVWSRSPRTSFQLRSSETTDHVFKDGDLRVHLLLNSAATADIAFPVTVDYEPNERHLIYDSDFGYAGGRIYTDPPYDVADHAVDEPIRVFLR